MLVTAVAASGLSRSVAIATEVIGTGRVRVASPRANSFAASPNSVSSRRRTVEPTTLAISANTEPGGALGVGP